MFTFYLGRGPDQRLVDRIKFDRKLFEEVKHTVDGACACCARTFGVTSEIRSQGVHLLRDDHREHPSLRDLASSGYAVITF